MQFWHFCKRAYLQELCVTASNERSFIMTQSHSLSATVGVLTAFVKQQNDSSRTVKRLKTMKNETRSEITYLVLVVQLRGYLAQCQHSSKENNSSTEKVKLFRFSSNYS